MMRVAVTGACGMIGTCFNEKFGEHVAVNIDKVRPPPNYPNLNSMFRVADLLDKSAAYNSLEEANTEAKLDVCLHLAANARVWKTTCAPWQAGENFQMAFNVIEACRALKIPIAFASSREVFGECKLADEFTPHCYTSVYGVTKGAIEKVLDMYEKLYGLPHVILRYSNVFGRHDFNDRVIPLWIKLLLEGLPVQLYGESKAFNFTYLDDAVDLTLQLLEKLGQGGVTKGSYNIAGKRVHLQYLFHMLKRLTRSESDLEVIPSRPSEVFDANIISRRLTWTYYDFKKALKQTVEWYRENDRFKQVVEELDEEDVGEEAVE